MNLNWNEGYAPGKAEDGKFVPINTASLSSLGYPTSGEGKHAVLVVPVTDSTNPMTTYAVKSDQMTIYSGTYTNSATVFTFNPSIDIVEIYNTSGNIAYILLSTTDFTTLTAQGIPIAGSSYYAMERSISQMTLGATASSNLRVITHYKA